jgi:hypothetical protein
LPLIFSFALRYGRITKKLLRIEIEWTLKLWIYVEHVNLLRKTLHTAQKRIKSLLDACAEVGLEERVLTHKLKQQSGITPPLLNCCRQKGMVKR